jgi:hypothetical protein
MNTNSTSAGKVSLKLTGANFSFLFIGFIFLRRHQFIQPALMPVDNKHQHAKLFIPGKIY